MAEQSATIREDQVRVPRRFQLVSWAWFRVQGVSSPLHLQRMVLPKAATSWGDSEVPNWVHPHLRFCRLPPLGFGLYVRAARCVSPMAAISTPTPRRSPRAAPSGPSHADPNAPTTPQPPFLCLNSSYCLSSSFTSPAAFTLPNPFHPRKHLFFSEIGEDSDAIPSGPRASAVVRVILSPRPDPSARRMDRIPTRGALSPEWTGQQGNGVMLSVPLDWSKLQAKTSRLWHDTCKALGSFLVPQFPSLQYPISRQVRLNAPPKYVPCVASSPPAVEDSPSSVLTLSSFHPPSMGIHL